MRVATIGMHVIRFFSPEEAFRAGTIYGASDRTGGLPIESPVTPGDVIATVYRLLGVDSTYQLYDALGRPHEVVPKGRILTEIIA